MTTHKKVNPARDTRDFNDPQVRAAVAREQANTPIKSGYSAPWGNSRFGLGEHSTPGCLPWQAREKYQQGDINALPRGCREGHPLPHPPGYTRG